MLKFRSLLLLILVAVPTAAQERPPSISEETWNFLTQVKWSKGPQALADINNPEIRIALARQ